MKKYILLTLIIAGLAAFKCNTVRHITGIVYGSDDKLPIPGATVKVKGTYSGVVTNQSGRYDLNAPDGSALVVSYIGYQTKTVTVGKSDTLDIYLDPSNSQLGEVVVTQALGIKHSSTYKGYSAATI
ncbi:MAG TPA: carboxypeptidase-like regulatory domain-containing protein, partial [Mucilaginibacter sp.]|nr:carboxypeptidase-like regulatory domain-containing protein [Mucilaginibacter sp.]